MTRRNRAMCARRDAADVQDGDGGKLPLKGSRQRYPFVSRLFAEGGNAGRLAQWTADKTHITLDIIRRGAHAKDFEVLPRRWIVERTFAWITLARIKFSDEALAAVRRFCKKAENTLCGVF
ncbi:transposase [Bosea sp. NBC_00550]|uniref:transposase n=1 Tax=Bosea sp. NBC_00550 TaxID=2969621 RepID=UPI003FA4AFBF